MATREVARLVAALVTANEAALESAEMAIHDSGPVREKTSDDPTAAPRPASLLPEPAAKKNRKRRSDGTNAMLQWTCQAVASSDLPLNEGAQAVLGSHVGAGAAVLEDVPLSSIESQILNIQTEAAPAPVNGGGEGGDVECGGAQGGDADQGGDARTDTDAPATETASAEGRTRPRSISTKVRGLLRRESRGSRSRSWSPLRSRLSRGLSWKARGGVSGNR